MIEDICSLWLIDWYKAGHVDQYPEGTRYIWSNWTPRYTHKPEIHRVVSFGQQYFCKRFLIDHFNRNFFQRDWLEVVDEYRKCIRECLGIKDPRTDHIRWLWNRKYLPLAFYSVPEGTEVPYNYPMHVITNTEPEAFWLVNYIETIMSNTLWQPSTSATLAKQYRQIFKEAATDFGHKDLGFVDWMGHDFSFRGMGGLDSAVSSGMGHLTCFSGTDTIPAIFGCRDYYHTQFSVGGSVPATEHSVMCAGSKDGEFETFERLIKGIYPEGIVSIVSDTWDLWNVLDNFVPRLRNDLLDRKGKVVIRPDCYDDKTEILTEDGFVPFPELKNTQRVAQYQEDGSVKFVFPLKYVHENYSGDMYSFSNKNGHVDLCVTPNHRMVIRSTKNEQTKLCIKEAEHSKFHTFNRHIHGGLLIGKRSLEPMERLWIAFQADGSYQTKMKRNHIRFNFVKKRKAERLRAILEEGGIPYTESVEPARPKNTQFYITLDHEPSKTFDWVLPQLHSISGIWAREFIEEISYWDSTRRSESRYKFDTTIPINAEIVQTLAALSGYRTKYSISEDNRDDKFSDVHTVHICLWDTTDGQSIRKKIIKYKGTIHCVTVESGMVIVRRNGCVSVSGNSGDPVLISLKSAAILKDKMGVDDNGMIRGVGLIYGDSITPVRAKAISTGLVQDLKLSPYNEVSGIGSFTYQFNTRDTFGFAMKATAVDKGNGIEPIFKSPVTDNGNKISHKGIPCVYTDGQGEWQLQQTCDSRKLDQCSFVKIFENGKLLVDETFETIRKRVREEN